MLEKWPDKIQALNGIRGFHNCCWPPIARGLNVQISQGAAFFFLFVPIDAQSDILIYLTIYRLVRFLVSSFVHLY